MSDNIETLAGPINSVARLSNQEIAENQLGAIDWVGPMIGYCECPGRKSHSTKSGRKDCRVYLDEIPSLFCLHSSCSSVVKSSASKLRNAILSGNGNDEGQAHRSTAESREIQKERAYRERIRERATKALPELLQGYAWPYADIVADSPVALAGNEKDHWKLLLGKFDQTDVVWIGDKYDSGKPEDETRFKPAQAWLKETSVTGPFICPVAFKNSCHARTNENVLHRRFLAVESDTLNHDEVGAVFNWLREESGLELVAIVDTAGKSLHGWFRFEEDEGLMDDLKLVLPAFECDPKLFTPSQPVRLPGVLRDGKYQRLIYLSGGAK